MRNVRNLGTPAAFAIVVASGVVACGGGSHGSAVPATPALASASPVAVGTARLPATARLTISVPKAVAVAAHGRTPRFVSPGTVSLSVSAAPTGGAIFTAPTVLTTATLALTAPGCTAAAAGSSYGYSCSIPVPIPAALTSIAIDVDVATYDVMASAINVSAANVPLYQQNPGSLLGEGRLTGVTVTQNTANATFPPVVLSGNVASVTLRSVDATGKIYVPVTGSSASPSPVPIPIAFTAKDASGATIIGAYLTPIAFSIGTFSPALGLGVTGPPASQPTQTPNPNLQGTSVSSSGDQLALFATGKGVLANTLVIAAGSAAVPTPVPIVADGIGSYQEYDVYGSNGYSLAAGGGQSVDTIALGANGQILYAFEDGGSGGGIGQILLGGSNGPVYAQCTIAGSPTFPYQAMAVNGTTAYLVDASTSAPRVSGFGISYGGTSCPSTLSQTLALVSGDSGPVMRMAVVNNSSAGRGPELWLATQRYLYAIALGTGLQETFYRYGAPVAGLDGDGTGMANITGLQPFDNTQAGGLTFGTIGQGVLYGDAANNQLDVAGVQPSPAPSFAPIVRESPGVRSFPNGSVAFTYADANGLQHFAYADTSGSVFTITPGSSPSDGGAANWNPAVAAFTTAGGFGPQFIVTGAENGTAIYGVGGVAGDYSQRGVIRYSFTGNTGTPITGIPFNYSGQPTYTGAVLGADGRIYIADSANKAIYAFPGYGYTGSNGSQPTLVYGDAKYRRPPAAKRSGGRP